MALPPINSAVSSLQTSMENVKRDAHDVASSVAKGKEDTTDLASSMVDLNQDRTQAEATVKVVQAVDEVLGTLLDVHA